MRCNASQHLSSISLFHKLKYYPGFYSRGHSLLTNTVCINYRAMRRHLQVISLDFNFPSNQMKAILINVSHYKNDHLGCLVLRILTQMHCFESSLFSQASEVQLLTVTLFTTPLTHQYLLHAPLFLLSTSLINNKYTIYKFKRDVVVKARQDKWVYGFENLDSAGRRRPRTV